MLNVLVVDDEILAIEYLRGLVQWEDIGCTIIGEATSAKRAMQICKNHEVDILITDIKMPGTDGLELVKKLKSESPRTKAIIVSAYKDFEYAKKAIEFGVSNYLLKHELNQESISSEIMKIRKAIEKDELSVRQKVKHDIKNWIYSFDNASPLASDYIDQNQRFVMMILKHNWHPIQAEMSSSEQLARASKLKRFVEKLRLISGQRLAFLAEIDLNEQHSLAVYEIGHESSGHKVYQEISKYIGQIFTQAEADDFYELRVVTTEGIEYRHMPQYFKRLAEAIRYSDFMTFGRFYNVNELPIKSRDERQPIELNEFMDINSMDRGKLNEWVENCFQQMNHPYWDLLNYRRICDQMNRLIAQVMDQDAISMISEKKKIVSYKDIATIYLELFDKLNISSKTDVVYTRLIQNVIDYIKDNYMKKLTLDTIGDVFDLNGVYIGQCFKKEVGTTFLRYITDYRMNRAKEYLLNSRMGIAEIAESVGYTTSQYFSQVFTKHTGMTPQSYRKWGLGNG